MRLYIYKSIIINRSLFLLEKEKKVEFL